MTQQNKYIITWLCLGLLGGAVYISKKRNEYMSSERRQINMADLKVPNFMKMKEVERRVASKKELVELTEEELYYDELDEICDSEIPVETRISPKQVDESEKEMENMTEYNNNVNEPLTEAEKNGIRNTIRGMIKDKDQLAIVLEEIPMEMIIAHISKKWEEAETFRRNISLALGGGK